MSDGPLKNRGQASRRVSTRHAGVRAPRSGVCFTDSAVGEKTEACAAPFDFIAEETRAPDGETEQVA